MKHNNSNAKFGFNKQQGRYILSGELDINTVPNIRKKTDCLFGDSSNSIIEIDLSDIKRIDSVGLALLIDFARKAKINNIEVKLFNIPEQMCAIARVSSLEMVLPICRDK